MEKQKQIRGTLYTFLIMFFAFLVYSWIHNVNTYYYDGWWYWNIGEGFFSPKGFNLYGFPETFRGYFWPFVCQVIKHIGQILFNSDIWGFRVFSCLFYAAIFGIVLPCAFNYNADSIKKVIRICLICIPILFFWGDFLQYPLSDIFAFAFELLGLFFLHKSIERKSWSSCFFGILSGAFLYSAYNTRAVYIYGTIIVLILFIIRIGKIQRSVFKPIVLIIFVICGSMIVAIPQMLINKHYTGRLTPKVLTEQFSGYDRDLQTNQIKWGIASTRAEGYVGEYSVFPKEAIKYSDNVGVEILERENIDSENFTIQKFIELLFKYPLDFVAIYTRHLVSLMTNIYSEVFIHDLYQSKAPRVLLSICLWILGGLGLLYTHNNHEPKKGNQIPTEIKENRELFVGLITPALLQAVGSPEIRFFLPAHILLYFYVCCELRYEKLWQGIRKRLFLTITIVLVVFFAWISIVGSFLSNSPVRIQTIHDIPVEYIEDETIIQLDNMEIDNSQGVLALTDLTPMLRERQKIIKNDTIYEISFELDCKDSLPDLLYFDLYGTNYDSARQDFTFEYEKGNVQYNRVVFSGNVPNNVMLRMIYKTKQKYMLKNFKIKTMRLSR